MKQKQMEDLKVTYRECVGELNPRLRLTGVMVRDSVFVPLFEIMNSTLITRSGGCEFMIRGVTHYVIETPDMIMLMIERAITEINARKQEATK